MLNERQKMLRELHHIYVDIMRSKDLSIYDHRDSIHPLIASRYPHMMDDEQLDYSRLKYAVAETLQPRTIYEVGLGWGVSAGAFISGCPSTKFFGIDTGDMGMDVVQAAGEGLNWSVVASDSLSAFVHPDGPIDLIHIDGGHAPDQKARDVIKAIEARPEWILIDDMHNASVAKGAFDGLYRASDLGLEMVYFPDSHTGNLLIHAGRKQPQYR